MYLTGMGSPCKGDDPILHFPVLCFCLIFIMSQLFEMPCDIWVLRFKLTALMQLLLYYGDAGLKEILSDEHVMVSAKCRVCFSVL